jgi:F-type H+-transporting ATPase subunit delta
LSDIATRYAAALFESVPGDEALQDRLRDDLSALAAVAREEAFKRFVENPRVAPADKAGVLERLAGRQGVADPTRRLLAVLAENERAGLLPGIAAAYGRLVDAARGREAVTVTAAFELPADLKAEVDRRLKGLLGARTEIRHRADPGALGGLVVQIGSKVFDHSIKSRLAELRQAI